MCSWRLTEMFTSLSPGYPRQSLACLHLFANLALYLRKKLLPGMLEGGGQIIFKWKPVFWVMWLVFKICSSIFRRGMCGQHATQSSRNFSNSYMFLQKSGFFKYFWWIVSLSQSHLPQLYGTELSAPLGLAIGSFCLFCWGIFTSPECPSELGWRAGGQQSTTGPCSSFQQIPSPHPALGLGLFRGVMPPGAAQPPPRWQVAGDSSRCLSIILPSPHPPSTGY